MAPARIRGKRLSSIPLLPPSLPRRGNGFSRLLGRAMLAARRLAHRGRVSRPPEAASLIVAPHTSNWDFVLGIAAVFALGLRVRFLAKHTLFYPPLGWLMRWFGGTSVVRETPQGAVAQAVAMIETRARGGPGPRARRNPHARDALAQRLLSHRPCRAGADPAGRRSTAARAPSGCFPHSKRAATTKPTCRG